MSYYRDYLLDYGVPHHLDTPHLESRKDGICAYYLKGICAFGSKCYNKHPNLADMECEDHYGKNCENRRCNLKHIRWAFHVPCQEQDKTIDKLPADLLRAIANFSGPTAPFLKKFRRVCRTFHEACCHESMFVDAKRKFDHLERLKRACDEAPRILGLIPKVEISLLCAFKNTGPQTDRATLTTAISLLRNVTELKIFGWVQNDPFPVDFVAQIEESMPRLKSLQLPKLSPEAYEKLEGFQNTLTSLRVIGVPSSEIKVLSKLSNLQRLSIQVSREESSSAEIMAALASIAEACPIQELMIDEIDLKFEEDDDIWTLPSPCYIDALPKLTSMTTLWIVSSLPFDNDTISSIAKCSKLQNLNLHYRYGHNENTAIPSDFETLCGYQSARTIDDLITALPNLRNLHLQGLALDTENLVIIYNKLKLLERLVVWQHIHALEADKFGANTLQLVHLLALHRRSKNDGKPLPPARNRETTKLPESIKLEASSRDVSINPKRVQGYTDAHTNSRCGHSFPSFVDYGQSRTPDSILMGLGLWVGSDDEEMFYSSSSDDDDDREVDSDDGNEVNAEALYYEYLRNGSNQSDSDYSDGHFPALNFLAIRIISCRLNIRFFGVAKKSSKFSPDSVWRE